MLRIATYLRHVGHALADRLAGDPVVAGVGEWGLTSRPTECLPPLAPHNAWGWSPPNPPVAEALGPDDPPEATSADSGRSA